MADLKPQNSAWSDTDETPDLSNPGELPGFDVPFSQSPPEFRSVDGFPRSMLKLLLPGKLTGLGLDYAATVENYCLEAIYEVNFERFSG